MKNKTILACLVMALLAVPSFGVSILAPGDFIIAVDADGLVSSSGYPDGEAPLYVLDGDSGTKYLNFGGVNSGFIVTLDSASQVQSFTLTTANDAVGRDPLGWEIYGTNEAIVSTDNSTGLAEYWTLLDSGTVTLPDDRFMVGPVVAVNNAASYSSYKMIYSALKDNGGLMQVADAAFYASTDGTGSTVLSPSNSILAVHIGWNSRYPGAENPANLIDGSLNKYLNFGQVNSGFIVTPGMGATIVNGFQITTANDAAERDPTTWELYGTNDAIASGDNSDGEGESWTLIASGDLTLPEERDTLADIVNFENDMMFASYKLIFPTVKDADAANSMQIAEIQFFGIPEPATLCLLGLGGLALLRRRS
ncbi:MAG: PEP-CTERM sorting domain-containing protein [Sedimentisphaerales bacterium]|nr:PEP-CTERM sorting domain-containing protein [Sedimentisphaerales bacterium]